LKVGTKSLLFGVHQFLLHPIFVALAWRKFYGEWPTKPHPDYWRRSRGERSPQWPVWLAFLVHDWGYWGCATIDGEDGKQHPLVGAQILGRLYGEQWGRFCKYHSRSLARLDKVNPSDLCAPDKLAILFYPRWLYLLLARASGELLEYMRNSDSPAGRSVGIDTSTPEAWFDSTRAYMLRVVEKLRRGADAGVPPEMMRSEAQVP